MLRFLIRSAAALPLLAAMLPAAAQTPDPAYYVYPVGGAVRALSANFGEMRPDHFHSGVDIKTDGVTGKPVLAATDGEVVRILVSPSGYGRALYVAHPNGTTTVYGHLSQFRDDIETYVREERYRQRRNRVDLYPARGRFPVRQGERIALSGNTGQSFGPHLHFEVRDTPTQRTLNTVAAGIIRVPDDIAPLLVRLHYFEVDTLGGLPVAAPRRSFPIRRTSGGDYRLDAPDPLPVGRMGYFVLEATDRKNGVNNTFGLYRVTLEADEEPVFQYRMDGYAFDETRYCNVVACYPLQIASRNEAIRLAVPESNRLDCYPILRNRGLIACSAGERRQLRIVAEDDSGNRSSLTFAVTGSDDQKTFHADADTLARVIDPSKRFADRHNDLCVTIPAGALYEPVRYEMTHHARPAPCDTTLTVLSSVYRVLSRDTPLHEPAEVTVRAFVPRDLQPHATLATINGKGRLSYLGGTYRSGGITLRTRTLGYLLMVADTVSPRLEPRFGDGADLSRARGFSFAIDDNFSGIASVRAEIDGRWAILDRDPIRGTVTHTFDDRDLPTGELHRLRVTAADRCGNTASWEGTFLR